MVNGNLVDFINAHPDVDRITLVGFALEVSLSSIFDECTSLQLEGVAEGLVYIHGQGMVHGDLKGVCL
jgi:hypothetical protein